MSSFRRSLPSLNALVVLEATARHRSITLAAQELGVTQAAVSRQIGALETELGTRLFLRRHRAIEPTPACLALVSVLAQSFRDIVEGVDRLRSAGQGEVVTIGATVAFSRLWLLPRLTEFRERFQSVQIRILARDERIDLDTGEIDVAVRFGSAPFEDAEVVAVREDTVFPVCSPAYLPRIGDPDALHRAPVDLIGSDTIERQWYSWSEWFRHTAPRLPVPAPTLRFNHYDDALQAARAGQGVALGWNLLVGSFLEEGSLVKVGERSAVPTGRYHVIVPARPRRGTLSRPIADWLAERLSRELLPRSTGL